MRKNYLLYSFLFLLLISVPVFLILIVGGSGASFATAFLYVVPLAFCIVIATSLLFYRKSQNRTQT
ncbi:MAG: hypothetical protein R6V33_00030 [Pelovirga sp.]